MSDHAPPQSLGVRLTPSQVDALDVLRDQLGLGSRSDVIRYALAVLDALTGPEGVASSVEVTDTPGGAPRVVGLPDPLWR